jgi:hypothetical protein
MHTSRVVILAGTLLGAAALLMPFVSSPMTGSVNGIEGYAWPAVALAAVPALMALVGDRREGFLTPFALLAIVITAGAALFSVAKAIDAADAAQTARTLLGEGSVGTGTWVLLVAMLTVLTGSVLTLSRRVG